MTIKITNDKLLGLWGINEPGPLRKILDLDLEIKTAYWISKIGNKVEGEIKHILKQRQKLFEKYADEQTAEEKENNEPLIVKENAVIFSNEFQKVLDLEVELDIKKIDFKLMENESAKLSPADIMALVDIIIIDEKE